MSLDDAVALRRYASVLVHEAAHLYLDTDDEDRCNAEMRAVSGLAYPDYVLDIPGGYAKAQLAESELELSPGSARLRDADGGWHDYAES